MCGCRLLLAGGCQLFRHESGLSLWGVGASDLARGLCQLHGQLGILGEPFEGGGQSCRIIRVHQQGVLTLRHHVGYTAYSCCHHGPTESHGLE